MQVDILKVLEEAAKKLDNPELFNKSLNDLYISKKGINMLRETYR